MTVAPGSATASERATELWRKILGAPPAPHLDEAHTEELDALIARRSAEGGAPPES